MKFAWMATALLALLACGVGATTYLLLAPPIEANSEDDALLWLRRDLQVPPETMARIENMHADYASVCEEHCRVIREARLAVQRLRDAQATAAELAAAEAKAKQVDLICKTSLEAHLRSVAEVIGGEKGQTYLATVLPRLAHFDHAGAPSLRLDSADPHAGHSGH